MGIPVLEGRDFDRRDDATGDFVTIIDASMARRFWPDDSPIGKRIKVGPPENEPWLTIVGVVGDALWLAIIGVGMGVGLIVLFARTLRAFVFDVSVMDPITISGVALLLLTVSVAASVIPARRAIRVDPLEVLTGE